MPHAVAIVEPTVGRGNCVAVVFVGRAVQLIGAALGDQHHLAARRPALIGALAGDGDAKLLDGIQWNRQHGVEAGDG